MLRRNQISQQIVAYKYTVIPEIPGQQVITAQELRDCLSIDIDLLTDAIANEIILSAQTWAENALAMVIFKSTVTTFRNCFPYAGFKLRKFPVLQSQPIIISYLVSQVLTILDSTIYFLAERSFFSDIFLKDGESWPADVDIQADTVKLVFQAGFGTQATDVPKDIKAGIKILAVYLFENPGDCPTGSDSFPQEAKKLLGLRKSLKV